MSRVFGTFAYVLYSTVLTAGGVVLTYHASKTVHSSLLQPVLTGRNSSNNREATNESISDDKKNRKMKSDWNKDGSDLGVKWTITATLLAIFIFSLCMVLFWIATMIYYTEVGWFNNDSGEESYKERKHKAESKIFMLVSCTISIELLSYFLWLVITFERLKMIMGDHTRYSLSRRTVRVCRCLIAILALSSVLTTSADIAQKPMLSLMFVWPAMLVYPGLTCWCIWYMAKTTRSIAKNMNCEYHSSQLLSGVLKLSIITLFAILSTLLLSFSFVLIAIIGSNMITESLFSWMWFFDAFCNIVCLYCGLSFGGDESFYFIVFGGLHRFLMKQLVV